MEAHLETIPDRAVDALLCGYVAVLTLLSLYGLRRVWVLWWYYRGGKRATPTELPAILPIVTIQLPMFNEANVVERLFDHITKLDWPRDRLDIQVLDDSTDETRSLVDALVAREQARGVPITLVRRTHRTGYKAGALSEGLATARGSLIAIFDADFAPAPDFLRRTVPCFTDPKLAFVQTAWSHMNRDDSILTRVQALLLDAHFFFEHTARDRAGHYVCFSGTAGVWRLAAIEDAGGWSADTLIEDADLSYRAQLRGWRARHLPHVFVPCELPAEINAWKSQQQRWAQGNAQVAKKLLRPILRGSGTLGTKLDALVHLTGNCNFPLVLLMSVLMGPVQLVRSVAPRLTIFDSVVLALNVLVVGVYFALARREAAAHTGARGPWRDLGYLMALGLGLSVNQTRAAFAGLWRDDRRFLRTPKRGDATERERYLARPSGVWPFELGLCLYYVIAIALAVHTKAWLALPFLTLFCWGFGAVAVLSLRDAYEGVTRATPRQLEQ